MKKQKEKLKLIHTKNKKGADKIEKVAEELKVIIEKIEKNLNQKKE